MFDFDTFITNRFLVYHSSISVTHSWIPSCSLSMLLAAQYTRVSSAYKLHAPMNVTI